MMLGSVARCPWRSFVAALSHDPQSGVYRILFRFGKKQFHKSLKTTDFKEAENIKGRVEEMLVAIEKGWITLPPKAGDFWPFLFSGGKLEAKPVIADVLTLENLFARYEAATPAGAMEKNSLATYKLHKNHL